MTLRNHVGGDLDAERRGGTGGEDVESKTSDAESRLYFAGDLRIKSLRHRGCDDHAIDIGRCSMRGGKGAARSAHGNLRHQRQRVIWPLRQARAHDGGIEHSSFAHHMPPTDARCLDDELVAGLQNREDFSCGDLAGMGSVVFPRVFVEGIDQLLVGNRVGRHKKPGAADGRPRHALLSWELRGQAVAAPGQTQALKQSCIVSRICNVHGTSAPSATRAAAANTVTRKT